MLGPSPPPRRDPHAKAMLSNMRAWTATLRSRHSCWYLAPRPQPPPPSRTGRRPRRCSTCGAYGRRCRDAPQETLAHPPRRRLLGLHSWICVQLRGGARRPLWLGGFPFSRIGRRLSLPSVLHSCGPRHIQAGRRRGRSSCRKGCSCSRIGFGFAHLWLSAYFAHGDNQDRTPMRLSVPRGHIRWRRRGLSFLDEVPSRPDRARAGKRTHCNVRRHAKSAGKSGQVRFWAARRNSALALCTTPSQ